MLCTDRILWMRVYRYTESTDCFKTFLFGLCSYGYLLLSFSMHDPVIVCKYVVHIRIGPFYIFVRVLAGIADRLTFSRSWLTKTPDILSEFHKSEKLLFSGQILNCTGKTFNRPLLAFDKLQKIVMVERGFVLKDNIHNI